MEATRPISWITDAVRRNELVAVIGTGVSMGLTNGKIPALSWKGLVRDGFAFGAKKGKITSTQVEAWKPQLESSDLDDLLGAAEFMSRKLDGPNGELYARWLEHVFSAVKPANRELERAIVALKGAGVPLCTLNYDPLLECVTGLPAVTLNDTRSVARWMRRESAGILHLHGSWHVPGTCVLGIRDYEATLHDEVRDLFQRDLGSFRRLLFIGCGETFADPNLSALIRWLRDRMKAAAPQHYALVTDREIEARHCDPAWHGFVEPLGYGASHDDLAGFLLEHFPTLTPARKKRASARPSPSIARERVLQAYRDFLIRDCGQMTIEGVRADMDTAQRRFDLERLFVPLSVVPSREARQMDPFEDPAVQLERKNSEPLPFGRVLERHRRLAILALPGGGKTMLLKRLAVAYADPSRRQATRDDLPDLDVTPVLIRCRDWREHIHRPIATLLQNLPVLTGQLSLVGLSDALLPLFRQGRILLLVDGLDEIHDDALRTTFVDNLEAFLDTHEYTRVVVTSREAGFALVAPSIARFCSRWRVAPLGEDEIEKLCHHWHRLMGGDSAESQTAGKDVAQHLVHNTSLRRLAENPLLLTMLLVVKHGAGRLPPDRVSLYGRAVEVLLDTWNIKGHAPLNLKEAVPQLACVAFQLMKGGKQTATEKELLAILDEARDRVPKIRRYAKDTPHDFLKRVELRSSLLIEAGHQIEDGQTVPFYQFRHLTFQEYLSAVACVEGHYLDYYKNHSVLTPLSPHLMSEEWKEVVPMAAVLARKQAEPLLSALVTEANVLRKRLEAVQDGEFAPRLPPPVGRLTQCLIEEAEASPETLTATLNVVAFFARGCQSRDDWRGLSSGPYGEELHHQAWLLYRSMQWPRHTALMETCARLTTFLRPHGYWRSIQGHVELLGLVDSGEEEQIARALFAFLGRYLHVGPRVDRPRLGDMPHEIVDRCLYHTSEAIWTIAARAWSLAHDRKNDSGPLPSTAVMNRLLELWLSDASPMAREMAGKALRSQLGIPRDIWCPSLTPQQIERIEAELKRHDFMDRRPEACFVAFHSRNLLPDDKIAAMLWRSCGYGVNGQIKLPSGARAILVQMGGTGRKHIERAPTSATDDANVATRLVQ
jgi:hypothetical protein